MSHRSRTWAHFALIVIVLLSLSVVSAQDQPKPEAVGLRPDAPAYALHGPYWVGTRDMVIDPETDEPLEVTLWYPALNPQGLAEQVTYPAVLKFDVPEGTVGAVLGHALKDAAFDLADAPYPLVVFSPGFGVARTNYAY
ncbi:MAG: hypothetical protein JNM70_21700, partial [Anaerolineae bacterium]|nr:hypothetical protein [Anaerolineae bacterium]